MASNVGTSMCVTHVLFCALGPMAASQGMSSPIESTRFPIGWTTWLHTSWRVDR
jgi:hypothetical protein